MAVLSRYQQKVHASLFAIHPFWVPDYLAILVMAPCYIEISQIFGIYPGLYLSIYNGIYLGIYIFYLSCYVFWNISWYIFWFIPWHPGIYSVTYPDMYHGIYSGIYPGKYSCVQWHLDIISIPIIKMYIAKSLMCINKMETAMTNLFDNKLFI